MKPKRTVKMPLRRPTAKSRPARPKLRSKAAAAEADYDIEDYEGESEPSMRFSHALFVVLILHVIAVAGVFAFNSIRANQAAGATAEVVAAKVAADPVEAQAGPRSHTVVAGDTLTRIAARYGTSVRAIEQENAITTYSTIRVGQVLRIPEGSKPVVAESKAPKPAAKPAADSAKTSTAAAKPVVTAKPIPAKVISKTPAQPAAAVPAASPSADGTYTVEKGDNPYSIARKFGVSYQKLIEINGIDDPTKVQIGQVLKLPLAAN